MGGWIDGAAMDARGALSFFLYDAGGCWVWGRGDLLFSSFFFLRYGFPTLLGGKRVSHMNAG